MGGESFAQLLKRHRIAAGLSQEALAERAGVSVDAISALERGVRHAPYKATLDLLIGALTLNDDARHEIEEAATLARARGPQAQRLDLLPNLPPQLTSFVDREKVVAEIKELLQSHHLVTLIGTGGAGKTRCAIKVGADLLDAYDDGVWLAELAPISDPSLVASVIARMLSVQEAPNRPMLDTLLAYLKRKRLLLILDNCEHVIEEARHVVAAILHGCNDVHILATSRESLTTAGEQAYRMSSLAVPSKSELLSTEEMSQYGAVQLFTDRATSADNRFTLSVESAPHVAEICRRLDGIPLAIELAATRVRALSPKQLAQKLDERFRVLTAGNRSALPRHQTMRALIDWSYDLLSDDERRLFRKLSIFAGGFTLETASAVWSDEAIDEIATLDLLSSLVDKSLVQAEQVGDGMGYRLLESTRQYAREKLTEAGEYDVVAREHARAFLALAEQLKDAWETAADRAWLAQAEPELENFRAALSWALTARGDVLLGQRLTFSLKPLWRFLFPMEGRRWVQVAQGFIDAETPPAVIAGLDLTEAQLATVCLQNKAALASGERARSEYGALDDPLGNVEAKRLVGLSLIGLGKISEGEALLHESLMEARAVGARKSVSSALTGLGIVRAMANDVAAARQLFGEALTAARAAGAEQSAAITALCLAETEFVAGDVDASLRLVRDALIVLRALHDFKTATNVLRNEAVYLVSLRRYDEARASARDAIAAALDMQFSVDLALALQHLAAIGALRPDTDAQELEERRRAARILGYVDARIAVLEALREFTEQSEYDRTIRALGEVLGADELSRRMAEGSTWSEDHAVAEAMLI
jgi:predicted ATPase/DNA-binding XRE family transcriptional regulator